MKWQASPKSSGPGRFAWVVFSVPLAGWILPDHVLLDALDFFEWLSLPLPNAHAIWGYERMYKLTWQRPFPTRTLFVLVAIGHFLAFWCVLLVVKFARSQFLTIHLPTESSLEPVRQWWFMLAFGALIVVTGFLFVPGRSMGKFNFPINFSVGELFYSAMAWMLLVSLSALERVATNKIFSLREARRRK